MGEEFLLIFAIHSEDLTVLVDDLNDDAMAARRQQYRGRGRRTCKIPEDLA